MIIKSILTDNAENTLDGICDIKSHAKALTA